MTTDEASNVSIVPQPGRVDVLGVEVSCIDLDQAAAAIAGWIDDRKRTYVCVTGMHGVMESQRDDGLRDIHNRSGLTTPDGMSMVWAGMWAGGKIERVYGPDLMLAVLELAVGKGWSSYFYGGESDVTGSLVDRLSAKFAGLRIAGWACPPFRPLSQEEDDAVVASINVAAPDIVWVALGTPKQERWMAEHRSRLDAPVLVGVGAAFALLSGAVPQAPGWMQRLGLEWAFRLAVEPRRLWRRYLLNIPRFLVALARRPPRLTASLRSLERELQ